MTQALLTRLQNCLELHQTCAGKWRIKGNTEKADMHDGHIETLKEVLKMMEKPKRNLTKPTIPTREQAESYAEEIQMPRAEGVRFFDHFESNGWRVGGKTAMKCWKAAMRNWRRNWAERNPAIAARLSVPKQAQEQTPAGWDDWLTENGLNPKTHYAHASGWMKDEFREWLKGVTK